MTQSTPVRRRNAADSRQRLLEAADELFSEKGYDRTTVREVGQRAGVDPAMIARYFGSKAALYLASLRRDTVPASTQPLDLSSEQSVYGLLERVGNRPTPTLYAAVNPHQDPDLQSAAITVLNHRMVCPSEEKARKAGYDDSQLRAEIVTAALAGIALSRTGQAFETLAAASSADLAPLITRLLSSLLNN
jgi:AcrR family transcriptional regulator